MGALDWILGKRSEEWYRRQIAKARAKLQKQFEKEGYYVRTGLYMEPSTRDAIAAEIENQKLIIDELKREAKSYGYNV